MKRYKTAEIKEDKLSVMKYVLQYENKMGLNGMLTTDLEYHPNDKEGDVNE